MEEVFVIGADHHNTLGVIRALGYKNIKPNVIIVTSKKRPYVGYSKYIQDKYVVSNNDMAIDLLKEIGSKYHHPIIIACSDGISSVLDKNRNILIKHFSLPGTLNQGCITKMMDKERMRELASEIGFCTPLSWVVKKGDCMDMITTPCITKPLLSKEGQKSDICICKNREELESAINSGSCEQYQIQVFVEKDFEYQLIGLSIRGGEEVIIPGISRCIRPCPGTNTGFLHYESLNGFNAPLKKCKQYIQKIGYSGLFSVEFLRGTDGKDYFLEINFRNDGNAICVTKAGFNLPYLWYMANSGLDYKKELSKSVFKPIYVMPEFDDFRFFVLTRKISFKQWLSDIRRTDVFMEFDISDSSPFWHGLADIFIGKVKRMIISWIE